MKLKTNLDYIEFYANKMKVDNTIFKQQKKLIESQLKSSSDIFKQKFGKNFKLNARKYLKEQRLIK